MTDPELARRAAALAASRSGSGAGAGRGPRARKRAHPAGASRILAAGLSATALFGLVAALTLSAPAPKAAETVQPVAAVTPPKQVVIVVHRPAAVATGPAPVSGGSSSNRPSTASASPAAVASSAAQPSASAASAPAPSSAPTPVTATKAS